MALSRTLLVLLLLAAATNDDDGVRAGRWAAVTLSKSGAAAPPLAVWGAGMALGMAVGASTTTPRRFPSHRNG